jgi:gluconokinase
MGVSASGKSSVAAALARRLQVPFVDGDDLHTDAGIAKMAAGTPLDDDDRRPWLDTIGEWLSRHADGGVVSCSALKRRYRDRLRRRCPGVEFLYLSAGPDLIGRRIADRPDHFMPATLLESQFDALEPLEADERGITVGAGDDVEAIVDGYLRSRR